MEENLKEDALPNGYQIHNILDMNTDIFEPHKIDLLPAFPYLSDDKTS